MKVLGILGLTFGLTYGAAAQQPPQQQQPGTPAPNCITQYAEAAALSPALLINTGFEIKAAIPGGLWLQKDKEVYFCNSGRAAVSEILCWKLRIPVRVQSC